MHCYGQSMQRWLENRTKQVEEVEMQKNVNLLCIKFGPDNWKSQPNLKEGLSFTFWPLFHQEIRILTEGNYQSQEWKGSKVQIHLCTRIRTKQGLREQEKEEDKPSIIMESGDTWAALGISLPSQKYSIMICCPQTAIMLQAFNSFRPR